MKYIYRLKFPLILILILCLAFPILADMQSIGGQMGIGAPISERIGGESFIRHCGADKLIYDFKAGSGTVVYDKSHNNNNGVFGAGAAAPTWRRNSLYFDGGDYVTLTGINHGISTGEFTISSFLNNFNNNSMYFDQGTVRMYAYCIDNKISFSGTYITDTGIPTIKPISIQITRDNSTNLECYINGKAQNKGQSLATDFTYNGTSNVKSGSNYVPSASYLIATMYSLRILNKGLSGIECFQEYLANKFRGNN